MFKIHPGHGDASCRKDSCKGDLNAAKNILYHLFVTMAFLHSVFFGYLTFTLSGEQRGYGKDRRPRHGREDTAMEAQGNRHGCSLRL